MPKSPNLKFNLISQNQSQKEVTTNEALICIDALINNSAIDICNNPKLDLKSGDLYIINDNPAQVWANKVNYLAYFYINSWIFIEPKEGLNLWVQSQKSFYLYTENLWTKL